MFQLIIKFPYTTANKTKQEKVSEMQIKLSLNKKLLPASSFNM